VDVKLVNAELHIEELILHGFAFSDRYRIGDAMERELARLFVEQGTPSSLANRRDVVRLDSRVLEVKRGSRAEAFGVQVAHAVYEGLST
jgi:hypothetical protein